MTDFDTLPEATRRAINFMSDRFFLVRADGTPDAVLAAYLTPPTG